MTAEEPSEGVRVDHPAFDTSVSHQARLYNYLLGGKDHFAADRAYAEELTASFPGLAALARTNRAFLGRAVRFMAGEAGLSQFLDIGTGIPAPGSTHEVAQEARPDARIVYVDNDPVVLAYARAFLTGREPGTTDYLNADLRDPERILRKAGQTLDFTRPVGLLLLSILHAFGDHEDPHGIVATLVEALPSGSYLALTHWASDPAKADAEEKASEIARDRSQQQYVARSQDEIARFFDGLELVEPGLVPCQDWRPDPQVPSAEAMTWNYAAGVARKP